MIRFHLTSLDLTRTRFAFSPLWEVTRSYFVLQNPDRAAIHIPWLREAKPLLETFDLTPLAALLDSKHWYAPDFLTPPPSTTFPSFEEEIATLRRSTSETIRKEVRRTWNNEVPDIARPYLDTPKKALETLAELLTLYWQETLEPHWPRLRLILENDVASRARKLALGGAEALFADFGPIVHYGSETLEVQGKHGSDYEVRAKNSYTQKTILEIRKEPDKVLDIKPNGRGLLLVPSIFVWPKVVTIMVPPWQPTVIYSPRGAANAWLTEAPTNEGLANLLGERCAQIFLSLTAPATTLELSRTIHLATSSVSHHLSKLSSIGLVTAQRQGREVYYHLTSKGEGLLELFE
jgi:Bacterial regulatory protein, arsR family